MAKVTVTTTPADILAPAGVVGHRRALVLNNGTETIYVGHTAAEATAAEGFPVAGGTALEFSEPLRKYTGGTELFASTAVGTADVRVLLV